MFVCTPVFAVFGLGPIEMAIVGIVTLLLFGSRLPEVARSMGKSIKSFKQGMHEIEDEVKNAN